MRSALKLIVKLKLREKPIPSTRHLRASRDCIDSDPIHVLPHPHC